MKLIIIKLMFSNNFNIKNFNNFIKVNLNKQDQVI